MSGRIFANAPTTRPNPVEIWKASFDLWRMGVEAQMVMSMRFMGMAGLWSVDNRENSRMVFEKPEAYGRAAMAASLALMDGQNPNRVLRAATLPLRRKTKSNVKRLSRRGPKFK